MADPRTAPTVPCSFCGEDCAHRSVELEHLASLIGTHDPTGADHLAEMVEQAERAEALRVAVELAVDDFARGRFYDAEDKLRLALARDSSDEMHFNDCGVAGGFPHPASECAESGSTPGGES